MSKPLRKSIDQACLSPRDEDLARIPEPQTALRDQGVDDERERAEADWQSEIRSRVAEYQTDLVAGCSAKKGRGQADGLWAVLAAMDDCEAEMDSAFVDGTDDDDEDTGAVDAAWAKEIQHRVAEIRDGITPTYAAEDVIAAMRIRFG